MAGVKAADLHLWPLARSAAWGNQTFGSLRLTETSGPWNAAEGGLRLGIEYRPPAQQTEPRRLVQLAPTIVGTSPLRRPYGRVRPIPDPPGQPGLLVGGVTTHWWIWSLTADEVETLEAERAPNATAEVVSFSLEVKGIAEVGTETWGFEGESQFSLAAADWLSLLRDLGYATPPTLQGLAGQAMTVAPAWSAAEAKMREVRRYLSLGEDRQALSTAYALFDAIAGNPYKAKWDEVLDDPELPAEKAEVLRRLLQAQANVLSKLGRHPAWQHTNRGDRQMLPLDHWEAELAIALTQLLLTAAERWRSIKDVHDQGRPVVDSVPPV